MTHEIPDIATRYRDTIGDDVRRARETGDLSYLEKHCTKVLLTEVADPRYQHIVGTHCLLWDRGRSEKGYGQVWVEGRMRKVHNYMKGDLAPGDMALHMCGNKACCNPLHVYIGDARKNMVDLHKTGYVPRERIDASRKVTLIQAEEIRWEDYYGESTQRALAKKYGITQSTVHTIVTGLVYSEAGGPLREINIPLSMHENIDEVLFYRNNLHWSEAQIAEEIGVVRSTVRWWLRKYELLKFQREHNAKVFGTAGVQS